VDIVWCYVDNDVSHRRSGRTANLAAGNRSGYTGQQSKLATLSYRNDHVPH
jgi:hypothetical protein